MEGLGFRIASFMSYAGGLGILGLGFGVGACKRFRYEDRDRTGLLTTAMEVVRSR